MRTYVINLERRKDRWDHFVKINSDKINFDRWEYTFDGNDISYRDLEKMGFDTDRNWIDPILNTHLTKGEVGCFLSHYHLWQQCVETKQPILILEDDAIIGDNFSYDELYELKNKGHDIIYLGWKEMGTSKTLTDKFVIPDYPYWGLAYVITPRAARILLDGDIRDNIIPVDEYLPKMIGELNPIAYKDNVVTPRDRSDAVSDILGTSRYDYFIDFAVHPVTVATDESKAECLYNSLAYHGDEEWINLGAGKKWKGGDMKSTGGGQKINLLKELVNDVPDYDVIFFCDGYDVFVNNTIEEITLRYIEFGHKVIFSSERNAWPDEGLATLIEQQNAIISPDVDTPYKYLNSGVFIGRASELKKILKDVSDAEDDQLFYQKKYIENRYDIALDLECYLFQSNDREVVIKDGALYNRFTKCFSCVYHGNGGESARPHFNALYAEIYPTQQLRYIPTRKWKKIDDDIIIIDFMSKDMCNKLIEMCENQSFRQLSYDKVPGMELRIREIDELLFQDLQKHWNKIVYDIVAKFWHPCHMWGLRDAFVIKYDMDGQRSLPVHTDASLVTGSIKLNDDYDGGELYFPRQGYSNLKVEVGQCILFPGQCSHGHTSTELLRGNKYSLTLWSKRYEGDEIDWESQKLRELQIKLNAQ